MWFDGVIQVFNNMFRPRRLDDGTWFYPIAAGTFNEIEALKAFLEVPEVAAVITKKAIGYSNGKFKVVNPKNGKDKPNDAVNKLLAKPNWFQSQKEFMMQTCLFHEIFGNEFLYSFYPIGFKPTIENISALYTLPPNLVEAEYADTLPFYMFSATNGPKINYTIQNTPGVKTSLEQDAVLHLNDNRVSIKSATDKDLIKGIPKAVLLKAPINNIRMAYESRGVVLKYRGAQGILSNDAKDGVGAAAPLDPKEVEKIQKDYMRNYGGLAGQFNIIISSAALKWQQMGLDRPDKLGLYVETKESFDKIKDAWDAPAELFSSSDRPTFENQREAWKNWYESSIIPDANERLIAINQQYVDNNYAIIADYSHLAVFQEDIKMRADALNSYVSALSALLTSGQITPDEYREELQKKFEIGDGKAIVVEKPDPEPDPIDPADPADPSEDPTQEDQNQNTNE